MNSTNTTLLPHQINIFNDLAAKWWKFSVLESQNEIRIPEIIKGLVDTGRISRETAKSDKPLTGLKVLDAGCGGGFLSEPLAKLGAQVTGVDPCLKLIECARQHIKNQNDIKEHVEYIHSTLEGFCENNLNKYDHVVAAEVLYHMQARDLFIKSCVKTLKCGGTMFVSTINRTIRAWTRMVLYYEYVIGIIPRGSLHWHMFVTPEEARYWFEENNCVILSLDGLLLQSSSTWMKCNDTSISYCMQVMKKY